MTVEDEEFNEHSTLHLILEGHELVDVGGWFGSTDPFFMLQAPIPTLSGLVIWQTVYTSAEIPSNLNPRWKKAQINLHQLCQNNIHKPIRIKVIDWEPSEKHNNMGYFDTTVADLLLVSGDASKTAPLKDGDEDFGKLVVRLARIKTPRPDKVDARRQRDSSNHSRRSTKSSRSIRFDDTLLDEEGLSDKTALWYLTLEGKDLTDVSGWFDTPDPYFQISIPVDNPQGGKVVWQTVSRSRHIVDSLNPVWSEVSISLYLLCGEEYDLNKSFRVFVFDNVDGGKPTPMGYFESTVKEMMKAAKDDQKVFTLIDGKGAEFGKIVVLHAQLPDNYSDSSRSGSPAGESNKRSTAYNDNPIPLTITATDSTEDEIVDRIDKGHVLKDQAHSKGVSSSSHGRSSKHESRSSKTMDSSSKRKELLKKESYKKMDSSTKSRESSRRESSSRHSSHSRRSISLDLTRDEKRGSVRDAKKDQRESSDHSRSYRSNRSKSVNDSVTKEHRVSQSKSLKKARTTLSTKSREKEYEDYSSRRKSYKKHPSSSSIISEADTILTTLQPDSEVPELQTTIPADPKSRDSEKEKEPETKSSPVMEMSPKPKSHESEKRYSNLSQRASSQEIASSNNEPTASLHGDVDVPTHDLSVALQQSHQQSPNKIISKDEIGQVPKGIISEFQSQDHQQLPDKIVSKDEISQSQETPLSTVQSPDQQPPALKKDETTQSPKSSLLQAENPEEQSQDKVIKMVEIPHSRRASLPEVENLGQHIQDQMSSKDDISQLPKALGLAVLSTNEQSLESACSPISDLLILSEQSQQSPGQAPQREGTLAVPQKATLENLERQPDGQVFSKSRESAISLRADPSIPPQQNSQLSSVTDFPKEETTPPPKAPAALEANKVQQTSADPYSFLPKNIRQSLKSLDAPLDSEFVSPYQQYLLRKKEKLSSSKAPLEIEEANTAVVPVPSSTLPMPQDKEGKTDDDSCNIPAAPVPTLDPEGTPLTAGNVDDSVLEVGETQHQDRTVQSKVSDEAVAMLRLERTSSDSVHPGHAMEFDEKAAALRSGEVNDSTVDLDKCHSSGEPEPVQHPGSVSSTGDADEAAKAAISDPQAPVKRDLTKKDHKEVALISPQDTHQAESEVTEEADAIVVLGRDEEGRLPGNQAIHNTDVPTRNRVTNLEEPVIGVPPNTITNLQDPDSQNIHNVDGPVPNKDINLEETEKKITDDVDFRIANEEPTNVSIDREIPALEEDIASLGQDSQSDESDSSFDPELSYLFDASRASLANVSIDSALLREGSTIHLGAASGRRLDLEPDCDEMNVLGAPFLGRDSPGSNRMETRTDAGDPESGVATQASASNEGAWPSEQMLEDEGPSPTTKEALKADLATEIVDDVRTIIQKAELGPKPPDWSQVAAAEPFDTQNAPLGGPTVTGTYRGTHDEGDTAQPLEQTDLKAHQNAFSQPDDFQKNDKTTQHQKEILVSTTSLPTIPQTESQAILTNILPRDTFHERSEEKEDLGEHVASEKHPSNATFEGINDAAVALGDEKSPITIDDQDLVVPKGSTTLPQIASDQERHHQSLVVSTLVNVPAQATANGRTLGAPIHLEEESPKDVGENATLDLFGHEDSMDKANMTFHLKVAANDLENMGGWFGSTNAFIEISRWEASPYSSALWHNVYRSENIEGSLSPEWKEVDLPLSTLCNGDLDSRIQICLFHWIEQDQYVPMGSFETTVNHLLKASNKARSFDLVDSDGKYGVFIVLDACVIQNSDSPEQQNISMREKEPQLLLHLQGRNMIVEKGWFGTPDIRFQIAASVENKDGSLIWQSIYVSDYVENSLNPSWDQAEIDLKILCDCNLEKPVRVSLFDRGDGYTLNPMGYFDTTISDLVGATKAFIAAQEGKEFGSIIVRKALVDPPLSIIPIRTKTCPSTSSKAPSPQPETLSSALNITQGLKRESHRNEGGAPKLEDNRVLEDDRAVKLTEELAAKDNLRLPLAKPEKEKEELHQALSNDPNENEPDNHNTEMSKLLMEQASLLEQNMQEKGILLDYSKSLAVQVSSLEESLTERDKLLDSVSKKANLLMSEKNSLEVEVVSSSKYLEDLRDGRNRLEASLIDTKAEMLSYKRELDKALKRLNDMELEYAETQSMAVAESSETVDGPNESNAENGGVGEEDGTVSEERSAEVETNTEDAVNAVADDSIDAAGIAQVQAALMADSKEKIAALTAEKSDLSKLVETLEQRLSSIERETHERAVADSQTLVTSQTENSLLDRKTLETSLAEAQVKVQSYANAMVVEASKLRAINEEKQALSKKASSFKKVAEKNLTTVQEAKDLLAKYKGDRKKQSQQKALLKKALKEAKATTKSHLKKWTEAQKRLSKLEKSIESRNKLIEKAKLKLKRLKAEKTDLESTILTLKDAGGAEEKSGVKREGNTSILESTIPVVPKSTTQFLNQADKDTLVSKIKELETNFEDVAKKRQAAVTAKKLYEGFWKDAKDEYIKLQGGAKGKVAGPDSKWGEFEEDPFKNLPEVNFDNGIDADVTGATEAGKTRPQDKKRDKLTGETIGKQRKKRENAKKNTPDANPGSDTSAKARARRVGGVAKRGRKPTALSAARKSNLGKKRRPTSSEARRGQGPATSKQRGKDSSKHPILHSETKKSHASTRRRPSSLKDSKLKNLAPIGVNVSRINTAQIRRTGHRVPRKKQRSSTDIVKEQLRQQAEAAVEIMEEDDVQMRGHDHTEDTIDHAMPNKEELQERKAQNVSTVLEEIDEENDGAGGDSVSQITAATSVTPEKPKRSYFSFGRSRSKAAAVVTTAEPSSSDDEIPPLPPGPPVPRKPPRQGERDDIDINEEASAVDGAPKSSKSFFSFGKKRQATVESMRTNNSETDGDDVDQMSGKEWRPKTPKTPQTPKTPKSSQSLKSRLTFSGRSSHQGDASTVAGDDQTTVAGSVQGKVPASPQLSKATKKFFKFGLTKNPEVLDPKEEEGEEVETDSGLPDWPLSSEHTSTSGRHPHRKRRSISQLKTKRSDSGSVCSSEESVLEESKGPKRRGRRPQSGNRSTDGTRPPRRDTERPQRRAGRAGHGTNGTTNRRSKGESDNEKRETGDKKKKKHSSLDAGSAHSVKSLSAPDTNVAQRRSLLPHSQHSADSSQQKDPKRAARLSRIHSFRSIISKEEDEEAEQEEEKREIEAEEAAVAVETEEE